MSSHSLKTFSSGRTIKRLPSLAALHIFSKRIRFLQKSANPFQYCSKPTIITISIRDRRITSSGHSQHNRHTNQPRNHSITDNFKTQEENSEIEMFFSPTAMRQNSCNGGLPAFEYSQELEAVESMRKLMREAEWRVCASCANAGVDRWLRLWMPAGGCG